MSRVTPPPRATAQAPPPHHARPAARTSHAYCCRGRASGRRHTRASIRASVRLRDVRVPWVAGAAGNRVRVQ
eukprot:2886191-Prymnesium_polylepis.1